MRIGEVAAEDPRQRQSAASFGPARVEIREPIDALRTALESRFSQLGVEIIGSGASVVSDDVLVWAVEPDGGAGALRGHGDGRPVVALVERPSRATLQGLLAAGARAVLERGGPPDVVVATTVVVASNHLVLPFAEEDMPGPSAERAFDVAPEELRWMRRVAHGDQVARIADDEGCSEREMYRRFKRLYQKLGATGRTDALLQLEAAHLLREAG
jgi:DNA-binding CsgD family transcriptional regulator